MEFILLDLVIHMMSTLLQMVKNVIPLKEALRFSRNLVSQ